MKIVQGESLFEIYGQPTPKEIHRLYIEGMRLIPESEVYPGECADLYQANGYSLVELETSSHFEAEAFIQRHPYHARIGSLVGPLVMNREIKPFVMGLWKPSHKLWGSQDVHW